MSRRPQLKVIVGSTRPGRIGPAFGDWFLTRVADHSGFDVELIDLATLDLPFMDEPSHPKLRQYTHEHTMAWSRTIDEADALVFVVPEYNYGYTAAVKNSIDFLFHEWADKAVGFVSYGGIGAGTRAVQQLKQVVTTLKMVPVFDSVNIPFAGRAIGADGAVIADADRDAAATLMLDELVRVTTKLRAPAVELSEDRG